MSEASKPKLCLNLVCKNEEAVIERCIRSCMPIIDSWCIVDTGSTDRTMDIIRDVLKDLPGVLHERPWVNFGHNKTEAMRLARGVAEHALLMDADDVLTYASTFTKLPRLDAHSYMLRVKYGSAMEYDRPHIIRTSLDFEYVEPVHEYLDYAKHGGHGGRLQGIAYTVVGGGARSADPVGKFVRDAKLLEEDLVKRPAHLRSMLYLAQSYRDAGVEEFNVAHKLRVEGKIDESIEADKRAVGYYALALQHYERRADIEDGVLEERFIAALEAAKKREHLHALSLKKGDDRQPRPDVVYAYLRAWEMRPTRAEPMYELARYLRAYGDHLAMAYPFASIAAKTPRPNDFLFVDPEVYRWRALDELAICAYWTGRRKEAIEAGKRLIATPGIPASDMKRIKSNLQLSKELR
jgi:hypothetical protein